MFKKVIQIVSVMLLFAIFNIPNLVTAADDEKSVNGNNPQDFIIYINTTNSPYDYSTLCCHIYGKDGEILSYGSKKERCTYVGDNIWKYENNDINYILDENDYLLFFYDNDTYRKDTNEILFDRTCLGDTVYFNGTMTENHEYYQRPQIFWENHNNSKYASILRITSSGEVIGNYCLNYQNPYDMFVGFLKGSYSTAIANSDKDEQTFINEMGYKLGLSGIEVERAIIYSGKNIKWYREYYIEPSQLTEATQPIVTPTESKQYILGDVDGDGDVSIIDATCIQRYLCQLPVYAEGIGEPIK